MRKIMNALAILALALLAKSLFPSVAHASGGGYYAAVCCGIGCGGYPFCAGTGPYTCCN
jgi:hypothetical protein